MQRTKILFLTTTGVLNGGEKQLLYLLNNMDTDKIDGYVCTLKDDGELLNSINNPDIKISTLGISSIFDILKLYKLNRIIKKYNPDIIYSFLDADNMLAKIFGRAYGKIVINSQLNCNPYRSKIRDFFERITRSLVDYQIPNSYAAKDLILSKGIFKYPEKIFVLPNCIEKKKIMPVEKQGDEFKLIAIGEFSKQKNFSALLKSLSGLKNISLIILGAGPLRDQLRREAAEYRIDLSMPGFVDNVDDYMLKADAFIHTALWEGMPNVVMEAMALKTPVIASDTGDVKRLIKDGESGFVLSNPIDPQEVRRKIDILRNDKILQKKFADKAYEKISEYSITYICKTFEKILDDIIKGDNNDK